MGVRSEPYQLPTISLKSWKLSRLFCQDQGQDFYFKTNTLGLKTKTKAMFCPRGASRLKLRSRGLHHWLNSTRLCISKMEFPSKQNVWRKNVHPSSFHSNSSLSPVLICLCSWVVSRKRRTEPVIWSIACQKKKGGDLAPTLSDQNNSNLQNFAYYQWRRFRYKVRCETARLSLLRCVEPFNNLNY